MTGSLFTSEVLQSAAQEVEQEVEQEVTKTAGGHVSVILCHDALVLIHLLSGVSG